MAPRVGLKVNPGWNSNTDEVVANLMGFVNAPDHRWKTFIEEKLASAAKLGVVASPGDRTSLDYPLGVTYDQRVEPSSAQTVLVGTGGDDGSRWGTK